MSYSEKAQNQYKTVPTVSMFTFLFQHRDSREEKTRFTSNALLDYRDYLTEGCQDKITECEGHVGQSAKHKHVNTSQNDFQLEIGFREAQAQG